MEFNKSIKNKNEHKNYFLKLKCKYILQKIFGNIQKTKLLEVIRYNKNIETRLELNYKNIIEQYSKIKIEIIPHLSKVGEFINFEEGKEEFYHIYLNDAKKETKSNCIERNNRTKKIKIIIDYQVNSFNKLFNDCEPILSINFKCFHRININNMLCMFCGCSSLEKLNISNFNTNNVTDMGSMFFGCSEEFQNKVRTLYNNIKEESFEN